MLIELAERGIFPDALTRFGIRRLLGRRLRREQAASGETAEQRKRARIDTFSRGPITIATDRANAQHYEVPSEFYELVLGPWLKYSCGLWTDEVRTLGEAETAMLESCGRGARLDNGQQVLDLGCGWGSLSLWMAEQFPDSEITAVSNSSSQKVFIERRARERHLGNVRVIVEDVADFRPEQRFDRIVSVEMLEHVRNHRALMERMHDWLLPGGYLFVHIFCHRRLFYAFQDEGASSWMARNFFTGGVMPSRDLLERVCGELELEESREVNGTHYARTLEAWLDNADSRRREILEVLLTAGTDHQQAALWLQRWRIFFMACAELFAYGDGQEWFVTHYLFRRNCA